MSHETMIQNNEDEALRVNFSDEEIETAAEAAALTYTYQTSAYNRCCR